MITMTEGLDPTKQERQDSVPVHHGDTYPDNALRHDPLANNLQHSDPKPNAFEYPEMNPKAADEREVSAKDLQPSEPNPQHDKYLDLNPNATQDYYVNEKALQRPDMNTKTAQQSQMVPNATSDSNPDRDSRLQLRSCKLPNSPFTPCDATSHQVMVVDEPLSNRKALPAQRQALPATKSIQKTESSMLMHVCVAVNLILFSALAGIMFAYFLHFETSLRKQ